MFGDGFKFRGAIAYITTKIASTAYHDQGPVFFDCGKAPTCAFIQAGDGSDEFGTTDFGTVKLDITAAIRFCDFKAVFTSVIFDDGDVATTTTAHSCSTGVEIIEVFGDLPEKGLLLKFGLHRLDGGTAGSRAF